MKAISAHPKRIGLALGSGSARGVAHVGVLQRLTELGIKPDIICGTSMGALVGACYACNRLDHFAEWISGLTNSDVFHYMEVKLLASGGVAHGGRLIDFFRQHYGDPDIADLPFAYAAIATDLYRGRETWLQKGSVWDAVRASIAIPGVLTPVEHQQHWLVDGGLVNPVPVSTCRALGADIIIAVNLNSDLLGRQSLPPQPEQLEEAVEAGVVDEDAARVVEAEAEDEFSMLSRLASSIRGATSNLWTRGNKKQAPGTLNVMLSAINIMQDRITRSRLAGDPADIYLSPRLGQIGFLEFSRASEAIAEGRAAVDRMLPEIEFILQIEGDPRGQKGGEPLDADQIPATTGKTGEHPNR